MEGKKLVIADEDEEMRRKREKVEGKKKAWDDNHCPVTRSA